MIQMTRDEWAEYCRAEAAGDLEAQREVIRHAEERIEREKGFAFGRVKRDCFAYYAESCECQALDDLMCGYGKCSFYKPRDKMEKRSQKEERRERKKRYTISRY